MNRCAKGWLRFCTFVALTFLASATSVQAGFVSAVSTADTEIIRDGFFGPYTSYGRTEALIPGTNTGLFISPGQRDALVQFELPSELAGSSVTSARLYLTVRDAVDPSDVVFAYEALPDFGGLSDFGGNPQGYLTVANPNLMTAGAPSLFLDVTSGLQSLIDSGAQRATFQVTANQNLSILVSRPPLFNQQYLPRLEVDFQPLVSEVPEPSSLTLLAIGLTSLLSRRYRRELYGSPCNL